MLTTNGPQSATGSSPPDADTHNSFSYAELQWAVDTLTNRERRIAQDRSLLTQMGVNAVEIPFADFELLELSDDEGKKTTSAIKTRNWERLVNNSKLTIPQIINHHHQD
eukprot:Selendium_serpulae@DN955_c0_g1_i1.p1